MFAMLALSLAGCLGDTTGAASHGATHARTRPAPPGGRLMITPAGGRPDTIFAEEALELLARGSQGVPRCLNQAAHQALLLAHELERDHVDRLGRVLQELRHLEEAGLGDADLAAPGGVDVDGVQLDVVLPRLRERARSGEQQADAGRGTGEEETTGSGTPGIALSSTNFWNSSSFGVRAFGSVSA